MKPPDDSLFADLALPSGRANALTPAKRAVLAALGAQLLHGQALYVYGPVSARGLRHCIGMLRDKAQQRAVISMRKAGWLRAATQQAVYRRFVVELAEPFATVAKRLAGAEALRRERMEARLQAPQERDSAARNAQWEHDRKWNKASPAYYGTLSTVELLALQAACVKVHQEHEAAAAALAEAQLQAECEPVPTSDEVLTWLVTRALTKTKQ